MSSQTLRIGLLGCGTVGRGLVELIRRNGALIRQRAGVDLSITKILVRNLKKDRPGVDCSLLTTEPEKVLNNGCELIAELIGGIEPARALIHDAISRGKHVVTANKALLALDGFRLMRAAEACNVCLGFEASVCGGIPIIRALRSGLVGNSIQQLTGILNGTCNYVLTRMTEDRISFDRALCEAQAKGFAEADPSLDIDGHDAAQKLKILTELAFNTKLSADTVSTEGIRNISLEDVEAAAKFGYVIKHVANAELVAGSLVLGTAPVLLPQEHQLSNVRHENNAVLVRGDAVGEMLFCGKGAGSLPTASAVLSDVVDIARHRNQFSVRPHRRVSVGSCDHPSRYYIRLLVGEASAVPRITKAFARNGVEVTRAATISESNRSGRHQVRLLTQSTPRKTLETALHAVSILKVENGKNLTLRVAA